MSSNHRTSVTETPGLHMGSLLFVFALPLDSPETVMVNVRCQFNKETQRTGKASFWSMSVKVFPEDISI